MADSTANNSFWGHLEVLRWVIVRSLIVLVSIAIAVFCFKEWLFDSVVLGPLHSDFPTYRFFCWVGQIIHLPNFCLDITQVNLININLASQFFIHMEMAGVLALVVAFPYIICELWFFVRPALHEEERIAAFPATISFVLLFFLGVAVSYFLIFPLTLNFLGNYQVSLSVPNQISLSSYISTFLSLTFMLGIVFEMPIVAYFFARIGVLSSLLMRQYRKIAIVIIMCLAAIITPSTDAFTMLLVVLPLWMLYELSLVVVARVERNSNK